MTVIWPKASWPEENEVLNPFRRLQIGGDPIEGETSSPIFEPRNASIAQGLLQAILENARIEMFSPRGGGVVLMRLDRWQIDVLKTYGLEFEAFSTADQPTQCDVPTLPGLNPEYLEFDLGRCDASLDKRVTLSPPSEPDDILSAWLKSK